jgi:hypothetical protein
MTMLPSNPIGTKGRIVTASTNQMCLRVSLIAFGQSARVHRLPLLEKAQEGAARKAMPQDAEPFRPRTDHRMEVDLSNR